MKIPAYDFKDLRLVRNRQTLITEGLHKLQTDQTLNQHQRDTERNYLLVVCDKAFNTLPDDLRMGLIPHLQEALKNFEARIIDNLRAQLGE